MGLSLEVVASWVKSCMDSKQLEKFVSLVERQREIIQAKQAAKAAKRQGT